jgi:hypothetical protein
MILTAEFALNLRSEEDILEMITVNLSVLAYDHLRAAVYEK